MPPPKAARRLIATVARATRSGVVLPLGATVRLYGSTDKAAHGYVPGYVEHLRGRRWQANRVLEIGVGGYGERRPGGSLRVWRDHLPRSAIVGFDINDKDVALGPRVRFEHSGHASASELDRAGQALRRH